MRGTQDRGYSSHVATNTREMPVAPEQVWGVLADPKKYRQLVVGTKEVRSSEGNWPAKSARFHHTGGIWPLHLRDQTSVLESDRPKWLVLQAQVRIRFFINNLNLASASAYPGGGVHGACGANAALAALAKPGLRHPLSSARQTSTS